MKLQFDANQSFQLDAINAAMDLFKGQPAGASDFAYSKATSVGGTFLSVVANNLLLDQETIEANLEKVQLKNEILKGFGHTPFGHTPLGHAYDTVSESKYKWQGMHFSIEMETGTGKTYVYLRTIHELYKQYGFKKFIIVVPSIAIKEGALKNLEITKEHFDMLYEKPTLDFYVFNPKKRGLARNFATTNTLQIMVMNIDQFTRAGNIFFQQSDWGIPAEFISATRPIVIVDEPQNMETDIRRQAIAKLNPLCTLRYSATHTVRYNEIYRLDPVKAYDLGLVKRIEVDGITEADSFNQAYIEVKSIRPQTKKIIVKLRIDVNTQDGVGKKDVNVSIGDDLYDKSNKRDLYKDGFIVNEIDRDSITFNNGLILNTGQKQGGLTDEIMKYQIESTINNHFEKEKRLKDKGIKVLTLFFIDRVANYRNYENDNPVKGKIALWFEEFYEKIRKQDKYKDLLKYKVKQVHNGYFSQDKKGILKDTSGDTAVDDDTYALIMKDKERLLDINEPLRFIFSHSALREGWDNPNVFQICTLNETQSTLKKRQEIGRGLRLPVNQDGKRVFDENINVLTVSANEYYEDFAKALQSEIEEECGVKFGGRIKDKKKKKEIKLKKNLQLDENFKLLWDKIKQKTHYSVDYNTNELIKLTGKKIGEIKITKPKLLRSKADIGMDKTAVTAELRTQSSRDLYSDIESVPDILSYIQNKTRLTRDTICRILLESGKIEDIFINPQQFMDKVCEAINVVLNEMIVYGIKYEKIGNSYWDQMLFDNEELSGYFEDLFEVKKKEKTVYDYIQTDSNIEKDFARECEKRDDIKFYLKLPFWFKIETPLGTYNPDWALVYEGDKKVYFVAETKGTNNIDELAPAERYKIICGKRHFEQFEDVKFQAPVKSLKDVISG
ncbi:MAG: DEAD/DEAH box helicase family protein [Phycisphaerae bacterium]|nr:DEAD/DEAH box helicase family protein [Phycisphaerae bacterium]MDD5381322.1 DEAD/DEAH box helicase family protein [Phycisphaerae bacterium]